MKKYLALAVLGLAVLPSMAQAQDLPFAVDLYGQLDRQPGNFFFSPYSIKTALEMTYIGARGTTADVMARVLHLHEQYPSTPETGLRQAVLDTAKTQLQQQLKYPPAGFTLDNANALWGDEGFSFNPGFISDIQTSFGGDLKPVNFKRPAQASGVINQWVAGHTQNKIQNLMSPDMLQGDPAMVLTNAIYFKASWTETFDPALTKQAKFHVSATQDVTADMMNMQDDFSLTQADGVKVLSIPYADGYTSMVIVLPDDNQGLPAVEAHLTAAKLNTWLADAQSVPVILSVPKFQVDSQFALKTVLASLGMNIAFDRKRADFTGIADDPVRRLYVGAVMHKAHIGVDEQGTEAAAATAVVMMADAAAPMPGPPPPPPVPFIADHPFLYLIRSAQTGEILFMGRVDDPTQ
jgi:serpin B